MNRWIAALAMGLATAANAPAAAPPVATHDVISSAAAAPREGGARVQAAGFVLDRSHASLTTESGGNALAANGPDPVIAWILAAGFLGIIVIRRTRTTQGY
jgi:hypothetical protein